LSTAQLHAIAAGGLTEKDLLALPPPSKPGTAG
jgi:hypothetical protein